MRLFRLISIAAAAAALLAPSAPGATVEAIPPREHAWPRDDSALSVMTYNVKGLPWPAGHDRAPAIAAIGQRLLAMRQANAQPHIVLLQEAFTAQAKAIARTAGYRYSAVGPSHTAATAAPPLGRAYAAAARWDRGEESANLVDSGLLIMSDYPILRVRRFAFPRGACAGFDCLASKGVMIAWIAVPGIAKPVAFVDLHLNSRHSTHVDLIRADTANAWQVADTQRLIASAVSPSDPVILGGDTNIGHIGRRLQALKSHPFLGRQTRNDLAVLVERHATPADDLAETTAILARGKDMLLSRNLAKLGVTPAQASTPFPLTEPTPLSDHAGYIVSFEI